MGESRNLPPWFVGACLLTACGSGPGASVNAIACGADEVADGGSCVAAACGVGAWGDVAMDDGTVFVSAGASGGDGTEGAPFSSIQAALDLAASRGGATIAIGAGTYAENLSLDENYKDIAVVGRCRELVVIDGGDGGPEEAPTLLLQGETRHPEASFDDVTVIGGVTGVYAAFATLRLSRVDISGSRSIGLFAYDSAIVNVEDTRVSGTLPDARGRFGYGIDAESASVTATGVTVSGNTHVGVMSASKGTVTLIDSTISDTLAGTDGAGHGLDAGGGASLAATGCTVSGSVEVGVVANDAGTTIELTDTVVSDTLPGDTPASGFGLAAHTGARASIVSSTFLRNTTVGVYVEGSEAQVDLVGSRIEGTLSNVGAGGRGVEVDAGAALSADGCVIEGNTEAGVLAGGAGTRLTLSGTSVLDTAPLSDGTAGFGVVVLDGASLVATSCDIDGNSDVGVYVSEGGTTASLLDCAVSGTHPILGDIGGFGVDVADGATLSAEACEVSENEGAGIFATDAGTQVDLVSTTVKDTRDSGGTGYGVEAQGGASLSMTGGSVTGNHYAGIVAFDSGTQLTLTDTEVVETASGPAMAFALGIIAQSGATLVGTGVRVEGTQGAGLHVATGASVACTACEVSGNTYAAALVADGVMVLEASTLTDTGEDPESGGGFGVYANATFGPPHLTLTDSVVGSHAYAAVWVDGDGYYDLERNDLAGGTGVALGSAFIHGNAVFAENGVGAWTGDGGLLLSGNHLHGAGVAAVLLDGATAALEANTWGESETDVWQQRCDDTTPLTDDDLLGVPVVVVCPTGNLLTAYDLAFNSLYLPSVSTAE